MTDRRRVDAVVFDLLFTLVHPGTYPNGTDRAGWLADITGARTDARPAVPKAAARGED